MSSSRRLRRYKTLMCKRCDCRIDCLIQPGHSFWMGMPLRSIRIPCDFLRPLVRRLVHRFAALDGIWTFQGDALEVKSALNILVSKNGIPFSGWVESIMPSELIEFLMAEARKRAIHFPPDYFKSEVFCRNFFFGLYHSLSLQDRIRRRIKYILQKRSTELQAWRFWVK